MRAFALCLAFFLIGVVAPAQAQEPPADRPWLQHPMVWGLNGHPFTAYPGISWRRQLEDVRRLQATHYRVNTREDGSYEYMDRLLPMAEAAGITIVPVVQPHVDWERDDPEEIYRISYELARSLGVRYRGRMPVWSLANETETHALLRPCETFDDGRPYPCEWGVSSGYSAGDLHGGRWAQVSAMYRGLSDGLRAGDPNALRAIGVAGWGRFGVFERMVMDGVEWDITVWHDYPGIDEETLTILAGYGRPIWITEFNVGEDSMTPEQRAALLRERIASYQALRERFPITGAFFYEMYDEPYWDDYEARQGLVTLLPSRGGFWEVGPDKPGAAAWLESIAAARAADATLADLYSAASP